jgi:hypothetical protein
MDAGSAQREDMIRKQMRALMATDTFHTEEDKEAFIEAFVAASKPYAGQAQRELF